MVNKYDVLDWQSFSEKKDIEEIARNTKDKNDIQLTAVIEIAMSVSSMFVDNLSGDKTPVIIWWIIFLTAIAPVIWLITKLIIRMWSKFKTGADIPDINSMINLFDNEICYYALMAESYSEKISQFDINNVSDVEKFYYIETCFYINKAIYNLSLTSNSIDKLYSSNSTVLYSNRKISYTRLKNIFDILDTCIRRVESLNPIISNIDVNSNYIDLCNLYKDEYIRFKKLFKDIDPSI